jgi:drug/metabolite transporter (DMT)-like permease
MSNDQKKQVLIGGIVCGAALCVASCFQQVGIEYTTVGKSGFLTSMYIVIVPILGLLVGKKVHKKLIGCIILAVIGLYFISITDSFTLSKGDTLVCICAVCFAVHIMLVDRFAPGVDGVILSCIQFFVSGILSGIPMLIFEQPEIKDILAAWLPILYAGVMSCGVAYTLQIIGQQHTEPAVATLLMSLESVFSMVGGIVIIHQIPTARETFGCVLLFIAVVIVQLPIFEGRKKKCSDTENRSK